MKGKKICIISAYTYIRQNINYGSLFQYFALEKYLKSVGTEPYWLRYIIFDEKVTFTRLFIRNIKTIIHLRKYTRKWKTLKSFQAFANNYLSLSRNIYNGEKELEANPPVADAYITGSDQVWGGIIPANYLTFAPTDKPRISYAASFGRAKISNEHLKTISPWIQNMTAVSVREQSGVAICEKIGVKALQVVDPTFLINASLYPEGKFNEKNYIFGYFLNMDSVQANAMVEICRNSCGVGERFFCSAGVSSGMDSVLYAKEKKYLSPQGWIGAYKNADCILTNTFHGTVFAMIFHKPFVVFLQSGKSAQQNDRIYALLTAFGMESRLCSSVEEVKCELHSPIDWEKFEIIKSEKVVVAKEFLKKALEITGE